MLNHVIQAIVTDLDTFLRNQTGSRESLVRISPFKPVSQQAPNAIVCTLISIEQDQAARTLPSKTHALSTPPITLSVHLLFGAKFEDARYMEGIQLLSEVIAFFQGKPIFHRQNTPKLTSVTEKVTVEPVNLDLSTIFGLWAAIGSQYQPSTLYKFRMTNVTSSALLEDFPEIIGSDPM